MPVPTSFGSGCAAGSVRRFPSALHGVRAVSESRRVALHHGVGCVPWPSAVAGGRRRGAGVGQAEDGRRQGSRQILLSDLSATKANGKRNAQSAGHAPTRGKFMAYNRPRVETVRPFCGGLKIIPSGGEWAQSITIRKSSIGASRWTCPGGESIPMDEQSRRN